MMHWIVFKFEHGKYFYISGTDKYGNPVHTTEKREAWKFNDFNTAMSFFDLGYAVVKDY